MFWCGCTNCDSTFPLKDAIDVHIESPFGDPVTTVTCPGCGAVQDYTSDGQRKEDGS